jgi:hypothetical protein
MAVQRGITVRNFQFIPKLFAIASLVFLSLVQTVPVSAEGSYSAGGVTDPACPGIADAGIAPSHTACYFYPYEAARCARLGGHASGPSNPLCVGIPIPSARTEARPQMTNNPRPIAPPRASRPTVAHLAPRAPARAINSLSQKDADAFEDEAKVYGANMTASNGPVDVPMYCLEIKPTQTNVHCSGNEGPMLWRNDVKMNNGPECGYKSFDLHYTEPVMDPDFAAKGETYSVFRNFNDIFGLETCGGPAKLSGVSAFPSDGYNQANPRGTPFIPPNGANPFLSPPPVRGGGSQAGNDIPLTSVNGYCNDTNASCRTLVQQLKALFGAYSSH